MCSHIEHNLTYHLFAWDFFSQSVCLGDLVQIISRSRERGSLHPCIEIPPWYLSLLHPLYTTSTYVIITPFFALINPTPFPLPHTLLSLTLRPHILVRRTPVVGRAMLVNGNLLTSILGMASRNW